MLKKLILENWKSFRYAELPIDPLTVLIGTNASGKSNAIEALEFLNRIACGVNLQEALVGDSSVAPIRGGTDWVTLKHREDFTLKVLIQGENEHTDYLHSITVSVKPEAHLLRESLIKINQVVGSEEKVVQTDIFHSETEYSPEDSHGHEYVVFNKDKFKYDLDTSVILSSDGSCSSLSFLPLALNFTSEKIGIEIFFQTLLHTFILNPVPSRMRSYSPLSSFLLSDGSNIAGLLAALPEEKKTFVESTILSYMSHLPERDIQKVWAEPVGRLGSDAMLYCEESWSLDEPPMVIDARGMSDGTLRFLAIVTALLTRPEGSQLVIEEVDNGLHPSRAKLLLKMLKELGAKRKIDILVTTHNPALLNALEPEMIPFVVVAHRDAQTGESKLTPLDDIQRLPKLLASGHIGDLATQGAIEKSLSQ